MSWKVPAKRIFLNTLSLYGDYKKRCILTTRVNQIVLFTKLISEIKYLLSKGFFTTQSYFFVVIPKKQKQLPPLFSVSVAATMVQYVEDNFSHTRSNLANNLYP